MHSDIARQIDLSRLEATLMHAIRQNSEQINGLSGRVATLDQELSGYVVRHAQHHTEDARAWVDKWEGVSVELAYRRGLLSWPALQLERLRKYLPTLIALGGVVATIIGFLTGSIDISVGR